MCDAFLVSSTGRGPYDSTTYVLDEDSTYETKFSPVALAELFEIDRVFLARTDGTAAYDDEIERAFERINVPCAFETIAEIHSRDDIDRLMQQLIEAIREHDPETVILDITHGFRSLPMVFFATVLHLDTLDDVELGGIYYGKYRTDVEESPIIDMTYLHTLMEWYHGINTFERTGELRPVSDLLDERKSELFEKNERPTELANLASRLNGASRSLDAGLPLQAGVAVRNALNAMDRLDDSQFIGPEERFLAPLTEMLERFSVDPSIDDWTDIELDMAELHRQRELVEFYNANDRYRVALECARELFINRLVLEEGTDSDDWLDRDVRTDMSDRLGERSGKQTNPEANEETPEAIDLWNKISTHRNWYAHSGFKNEGRPSEQKIDSALTELCEKLDDKKFWQGIV
ncbi:TIGR02221 family CRISPR-associated protein [Halocatena marina]|uniref:TIGR02221 family CRISPR-associated protein n=1 Tax=Halocatena marina TaxID=2934937 RepID=UPI0020102149|nr:TIGR02221 family CRISPR-associated protein [Halocatena marina]